MKNANKNIELVKIFSHNDNQAVSASELHRKLQVKTKFMDWMPRRIKEYGFIEGQDFVFLKNETLEYQALTSSQKKYVRGKYDYALTINMAKELAMLERNNIGKKIRRYFIEVEEKFRQIQWHGLPTLIYKNDVYVNYKASLRELGYSTISGAVQARKRIRPGMFTLMFGQNWIKVDYANLLAKGAELRQLQIEFKELEKNIGGQDVN